MVAIGAAMRRRYSVAPRVVDAFLALLLTVLVVLDASAEPFRGQALQPAALLMTAPLIWRRRWPLLVFVVVIIGAVAGINAVPFAGLCAVMVAAYSTGAYDRNRPLSLGVMALTATFIALIGGGMPDIPQPTAPYLILLPLWLVGDALRAWRLRATASEDRATRLEQEREQAMRAATAEEQARIARELHDVVAHSVSVMVVQAGAARHVVRTSPEQAYEALLAVETCGREAMTELRRLLGVLNHDGDDDGVSLAPQPGVTQLHFLVRRVGEAGLPVSLRVEGQPRPLLPSVDLTVYRIVQEALTNALKYANLAHTEVILDYREAELKVEILDEGPGQAIRDGEEGEEGEGGQRVGHGLVGMRERVALYGGTLEAGPRLERGYAVRAWLPLPTCD